MATSMPASVTNPRLIGIFGQKHNGKSTLAKLIQNEFKSLSLGYTIKGFAGPLKETIADLTGESVEYLNSIKDGENPFGWVCNVRQAYQKLGQCMREIMPAVWIEKALRDARYIIFDDGRYENESLALREVGGFRILIVRPDKYDSSETHESERWVGSFMPYVLKNNMLRISDGRYYNSVVFNDGTEEMLKQHAEKIVEHLMTNGW